MKTKLLAALAAILTLGSLSSCVDPYYGSGRSSYRRPHHSHHYGHGGYSRSGSVGGYRGGGSGGGFGGSFGGFNR